MLQRLKAKKTWSPPERAIVQTPKLPFEVLFRIIDQEFATAVTPQAKASAVANIGRTCRELAIHCRALLFRFVHLQLEFGGGPRPLTDLKQSPAGRFAHLARSYPHILSLVEHLSLQLRQGSPSAKNRLYDAATGQGASRRKEWLGIMTATYPNLKILALTSPIWAILHREIKEAVIKMLLQQQSLEVLVFDLGGCPTSILQYCPPSVKHLSYVNCAAGELPISPLAREKPTLEGFKFAVNYDALRCEGWLTHIASMLDLGSLKSMQLWSTNGLPGFATFGTAVQPFSATLRCLHLLGASNATPSSTDTPPPNLDLNSLHALQLFEVAIGGGEVKQGLEWVSRSIATIPLQRRAARTNGVTLIICIQTIAHSPLSWPSAGLFHADAADVWSQVQPDEWPIIQQMANVYAFSEHCEYFGRRDGNILGLLPRKPIAHSMLLTRLCSCFRVQERVSAASLVPHSSRSPIGRGSL
jgi:hypothetical protein